MSKLTKNRIIKFIQTNGGYFAIIGAISMALSALISFLLNYSVNPNFNIVSYAVSDLVSGPMISGAVYSVGLIISSFIQLPTYISLIHCFNKKETYVSLISIGIIELKKMKVSKIIPIISFIVGGLYSIVWIRFLLSLLVGIPDILLNHAIQWFGLIGIISWTVIHGIFLIKAKKLDFDNTRI